MNVPLEVAFMSNSPDAKRDPIIKNRIHFKLPDNWCNSIANEKSIGIRNIFIAKSFKHPVLKLQCDLMCDTRTSYLENPVDDTAYVFEKEVILEKYFDDETMLKDFVSTISERINDIIVTNVFTADNGFDQTQLDAIKQHPLMTVSFEYTSDASGNHYNRLVFESKFNELPLSTKIATVTDINESITYYKYYVLFNVTTENTDASTMFADKVGHYDNKPICFNNVWDRNSCIVYSNISEECDNGYLGHTRRSQINPIKYYRVKGSNRSFWVDLYATCDHKAPVVLPADDELFIEAQLL